MRVVITTYYFGQLISPVCRPQEMSHKTHHVVVEGAEVAIAKVHGAAFQGDAGLCLQRLVFSVGIAHLCCFIVINIVIFIIIINPCLLLVHAQ